MIGESSGLAARARVHAALAEPVRLAVVDRLLQGDASPSELQELLGLPSNLMAHHLSVLTGAGVVTRTRSEGDRRRTYVRLVPEALPGLVPPARLTAARVMFVCTHNSARSQLAAAAWARRSRVPAASAGTHPARHVHPGAVAAAHRHGLRLSRPRTHQVEDMLREGDLVVAICDNAHEQLPADLARLHWSVPDPVRVGTDDAFDQALADIKARVSHFAPTVTPREDSP